MEGFTPCVWYVYIPIGDEKVMLGNLALTTRYFICVAHRKSWNQNRNCGDSVSKLKSLFSSRTSDVCAEYLFCTSEWKGGSAGSMQHIE